MITTISHRARIWKGLHLEFTMQLLPGDPPTPVGMECSWEPAQPPGSPRLLKRYRDERHIFLEKVADEIGAPVACVDV
jgi:hypothetical protein